MQMEPRVTSKPCPHDGLFVRAVVVENQVDGERRINLAIDLAQKRAEFRVPVPAMQCADDFAVSDVQRGKQ